MKVRCGVLIPIYVLAACVTAMRTLYKQITTHGAKSNTQSLQLVISRIGCESRWRARGSRNKLKPFDL